MVRAKLVKRHGARMRPIGIFDSGIGGLTVVRQWLKPCPNIPFFTMVIPLTYRTGRRVQLSFVVMPRK